MCAVVALVPAGILPFVSSLFYFVFSSQSQYTQLIYTGTKVFTLVWPLFAVTVLLAEPLPRLRFRWGLHARAVPLGAVVGFAIAAGMLLLARGPLAPLLTESAPRIKAKAQTMGIVAYYVPFALGLSILHSLLEEYAWRWFLFGQLSKRVSNLGAHGIAAIAFSAHHVVIATQFFGLGWGFALGACVAVGGVLFSWLYQRQGTLVGAWVAHILADLAIMLTGYGVLYGS
jgi:membrane protease YdiL (CAAX protease family)